MKLAEAVASGRFTVRSLNSGEVAIFYPRFDPVYGRERMLKEVVHPYGVRDLITAGISVAELLRSPNLKKLLQQPGAALILI